MKKSKKVIVMLIVLLLILVLGTGIYAYFSYQASVENTIVLGYNKIELNENYIPPLKMEKGVSFTKEPYVTNTGNVDCYVRVKVRVSDSRVQNDLDIDYKSSKNFDDNSVDWYENPEDGYYYYKKTLKKGESTNSLFTTVKISETADDLLLEGFDIYVYAESVQTVKNKSIMEVWNYFKQI